MLTVALVSACKNSTSNTEDKTVVEVVEATPDYQYYGDTISPENAIPVSEILANMKGKDSIAIKVTGVVNESCKKKGCWMKMDLGNGEEMRVSFKDYEFFVPKNLEGETAIMEGYVKVDTTDVAMLKHLAMDAEKSQEEIDAITEPEIGINYVATGVIIKPKS